MKNKVLKKGDIILAVVVLMFCVVLFLGIYIFNNNEGNFVQIEVDGKVVANLPLDEDTVYEIKKGDKITNKVVISNGKVDMTFADCRDKICVNHKEISKTNESIICLPNKVIVMVIDNNKDNSGEIDGVA